MAVYDDQKKPENQLLPSDDELRRLTGIDPDQEGAMEREAQNAQLEDQFNQPSAEPDRSTSPGLAALARSEGHPTSNENADTPERAKSGQGLKDAESSAGGSDKVGQGFKDDDEGKDPRTRRQRLAAGALFGAKAGLKQDGKKKSKKWLILGVGGGLGGLGLLVIIIGLFGALLIPQLAQHIGEYEFARVTRQFSENAQRVTDEKLALDAVPDEEVGGVQDGILAGIKDSVTAAGEKTAQLWSAFDNYRPTKIIKNLQADNSFKLNYKTTGLTGRSVLNSVELDGAEYAVEQQGFSRFVPVLGQIIKFKNDLSFSQDFAPALDTALRDRDIGTIIRGATAKEIREKLDIGLVAWIIGKYTGKDPEDARIQQAKDLAGDVDADPPADNAATAPLKDADSTMASDEKTALSGGAANDAAIADAISNDGILASVKSALGNALEASGLTDVLSAVNPIYGIAMPVCIIWDGSLEQSGPTIDQQSAQQQRSFYYLSSAADQEKAGDANAEAVGALTNDVNAGDDVSDSNPELRSAGDAVNTTDIPSAEASADGEYTLLSATPGIPGPVVSTLNSIADTACPVLTNTAAAVAIGLGNLAVGFLTGGATSTAEKVAGGAAEEVVEDSAEKVAEDVGASVTDEAAGNPVTTTLLQKLGGQTRRLGNFLWETGKNAATISALTVVAKLVVLSRSGQLNSGLAEGNDLVNEADAGGNAAAGQISQEGNYGRPMMQSEVAQSNMDDQEFVAEQTSHEDSYQRYLALDNADSLLSRVGLDLYSDIYGRPIVGSILSLIGKVFNPVELVSSMFSGTSNKALAATTADTSDYGNVQFGWSDDEENLIDSDNSYRPLENQEVLDKAATIRANDPNGCAVGEAAEDCISATYGACFTDSIGTLLSSGDIQRDSSGNVIPNEGLCSPDNLGDDNPDYGTLVFRWRLAMSYNTTLTQLTQEANAGGS